MHNYFCLLLQRSLMPSRAVAGLLVPLILLLSAAFAPVSAFNGCVETVALLKNREYPQILLKEIRGARKEVIFSFYLFKIGPLPGNQPRRIAEELISARNRGVAVTVILERSDKKDDPLNVENNKTAALLSQNGIKVLFDSPGITTHTKAVLIDNRYVFIGSHNLTQSALQYNNELSVRIDSPAMAEEIRSYLNRFTTR